jgi:hypothetical protein
VSAAVAEVPTTSGSKYLQQLCKHWSHDLDVSFDADHGTVTFPQEMRGETFPTRGVVRMDATADRLTVRVEGGSPDHVARLKAVAASHLDRFAFREAPLPFGWVDDA